MLQKMIAGRGRWLDLEWIPKRNQSFWSRDKDSLETPARRFWSIFLQIQIFWVHFKIWKVKASKGIGLLTSFVHYREQVY